MYIRNIVNFVANSANYVILYAMNTFENKLTVNNITFRYAKGKSLAEGNEIHPYNEILYYMGGEATFLSEKFREKLEEGTLLIIPKETYHQFEIKDQENYKRLVINFPDMQIFKKSEILLLKNADASLHEKICRILKSDINKESAEVYLYGAFLMMIAQLDMEAPESEILNHRKENELISRCIEYIDKNFTKDISADSLAEKMNVSPSTLFHCFKKELGISLYKYITEKRLIFANKLLEQGEKPTKIYMQCGYKDYPTFYKAYTKMFGKSPSKH